MIVGAALGLDDGLAVARTIGAVGVATVLAPGLRTSTSPSAGPPHELIAVDRTMATAKQVVVWRI